MASRPRLSVTGTPGRARRTWVGPAGHSRSLYGRI